MIGLLIAAATAAAAVSPPRPVCTAATARRTTVAEIGENLDDFRGRCFRVGGPFGSIALYGGVADLYLTDRFALDGNRDPAVLRRGRIGLYSRGDLRGVKPITDGIPHIEIVGTVDSCEAMYAQAIDRAKAKGEPDPIIMMSGYCHYYSGAVVRAVTYSFAPSRRYDRMVGDANRKRFGDLVSMPRGWRDRAALDQAMADWRAMIDRGDRVALRTAHDFGDTENDFEKATLDRLLDPSIATAPGRPARSSQIFIPKLDVDRLTAGRTADPNPKATFCICRTTTCAGAWPIASRDADNHRSRPYICTKANWRSGKGERRLFESSSGRDGGLGEPRRTSMIR